MAKRPSYKVIRAARTYTIEEAAEALGVAHNTVRLWIKGGLPIMDSKRPFLILGDALRHFLLSRRSAAKKPLAKDQLYCLCCKVGRRPLGQMVDAIPQTPKTIRLFGLCEECGGVCNRMISLTKLHEVEAIFSVAIKTRQEVR